MLTAPTISAFDLAEAERLAVESDPVLQALDSRASASRHLAVAAAQLPDPALQMGAQAVPLPSFDVRDEPMTQFQLGVEQRVPAPSQRQAAVQRVEAEGEALNLQSNARALQVRAAVREQWTEIVRLQSLIELTEARAGLLVRYSEALESGLGNGRVSQQTLLEGRTRELRVQRALTQLKVGLAERRAELAAWLPGIELPESLDVVDLPETRDMELAVHPEVIAAGAEVQVAEAEIAAAQSSFDPGWSWSLGVGRRVGDTPAGAPDETLLNAQLRIELPLFTRNRQSQRLAAARASHRAALTEPVEIQRRLAARLEHAEERVAQYVELDNTYSTAILPRALDAAEAARDKYRNGTIPLEDVLAAEIEVLEIRHERIEARLEIDRARIELAYLGGL
jgi:outer membrane protein TolC